MGYGGYKFVDMVKHEVIGYGNGQNYVAYAKIDQKFKDKHAS